jgi:Undecaprenyl-phosphate galactose phosphotransferase WbaP
MMNGSVRPRTVQTESVEYRARPAGAVAADTSPIPSTRSEKRRSLIRLARVLVLASADLTVVLVAMLTAYAVWALPVHRQPLSMYANLAPLLALFIFGYAFAGLYPGFGLGPVETFRRQSYVTAFGFLVLAAFSFAFRLPPLYSRVTFTIALSLSLIVGPIARAAITRAVSKLPWWREPVVVIGTGERAVSAIRSIQRASQLGYQPVAALSFVRHPNRTHLEGIPIIGGLECAAALSAQGVRIALLEVDNLEGHALLDQLQQQFRHVVLLRQYEDLPVEGLQVRNLGSLVGVEYTNNLLVKGNQVIKGILDVVIGVFALALAAPVIAVAVAAVKIIDRGPMFFFQDRAGRNGRRIAVPKIRTMRLDAEQRLEEHLAANPDMRAEWEARYKLQEDPRLIPWVGKLFRRFSIDELPQLWTVVMGGMSLVGPRPFPDYHIKMFSPEFQKLRQRVRPGISGVWQVTVRSDGDVREQEAYDSYYIRNWSVWLDVYILARTLGAVLSGRGAY